MSLFSFNIFTSIHSWNPPLLKGGRAFQKLSHLGGVQTFLLESGDKPEKGGLM